MKIPKTPCFPFYLKKLTLSSTFTPQNSLFLNKNTKLLNGEPFSQNLERHEISAYKKARLLPAEADPGEPQAASASTDDDADREPQRWAHKTQAPPAWISCATTQHATIHVTAPHPTGLSSPHKTSRARSQPQMRISNLSGNIFWREICLQKPEREKLGTQLYRLRSSMICELMAANHKKPVKWGEEVK